MNAQPHVQIVDATIKTRNWEDKATKEKKSMEFQSALLHRGDGVVLPVDLGIRNGAHPAGSYALAPASFSPGKFGRIELQVELGERLDTTAPAKPAARAVG